MADETKTPKTEQICDLNDRFRKGDPSIPGQMVMTSGVQELASIDHEMRFGQIIETVRSLDEFSEDNDPHHEHDFGAFEIFGEKLFWKFDYYAPDLMHGSEDPADISRTVRVLTIMLASEY
jgi:hypothetical protein